MNDLISRQAAINVVERWFGKIGLYPKVCIDELISLPSAQPEHGDTTDFWEKRAREYEKIIIAFLAEQATGMKSDSMQITENGITFQKSKLKAYTKADYIMALHKEYGCTLKEAEEAHNKALEYLQERDCL